MNPFFPFFFRRLRIRYNDWRRGYSTADITSACNKFLAAGTSAGTFVELTPREMKAVENNWWIAHIKRGP